MLSMIAIRVSLAYGNVTGVNENVASTKMYLLVTVLSLQLKYYGQHLVNPVMLLWRIDKWIELRGDAGWDGVKER